MFDINITKYQTIIPSQHILNNIIINNSSPVSHSYYTKNNHFLYLAYQINLLPQNKNGIINFYVKINNNIIYTSKASKNGFSFYKKVKMNKGYHNISITSLSNDNWGSCPSLNNGFSYGRYFYTWIQNIKPDLLSLKFNIVHLLFSFIK